MAMKDGMKNYRNMMKRMEGMGMGGPMSDADKALLSKISNDARTMLRGSGSGSTSDAEFKAYQDAVKGSAMAGMAGMGMDMAKPNTTGGSVSDEEMELLSDTFGSNLTDLIRNAFEGLRSMGVSAEDAIEALLMSNDKMETPMSMTEGALGALSDIPKPMMRPKPMPERLDADRTQSMDMQKTGMGT